MEEEPVENQTTKNRRSTRIKSDNKTDEELQNQLYSTKRVRLANGTSKLQITDQGGKLDKAESYQRSELRRNNMNSNIVVRNKDDSNITGNDCADEDYYQENLNDSSDDDFGDDKTKKPKSTNKKDATKKKTDDKDKPANAKKTRGASRKLAADEDDKQEKKTRAASKKNANEKPKEKKTKAGGKKGKASDEAARGKILEYFKMKNRPFNASTIHENLKKEFSKPCVIKTLDMQVTENELATKEYPKMKIFWYNQELLEGGNIDEVTEEFEAKDKELKQRQKGLNALTIQNKRLIAEKTDETVLSEQQKLQAQNSILDNEITLLEGQHGERTDEQLQKEQEYMENHTIAYEGITKEINKRKRLFKETLDTICEWTDKSRSQMLAETELEFEFISK